MEFKENWDLSPLFASDDDPRISESRKEVEAATESFAKKWKEDQAYLADPKVLRRALDEYEAWSRTCAGGGHETYYAWLRSEQDQNDPKLKAALNRAEEFGNRILNQVRFFELSLAKIPQEKQGEFLGSAELTPYRHMLERLFEEAKYLLGEKEENILALKSGPAYAHWVRLMSGLIAGEELAVRVEGKEEKKTFEQVLGLIDSTDKATRDSAAEALNALFRRRLEIGEAELNAILTDKKIDDELRGLDRPDKGRHVHDDIDTATVDALLGAVERRYDLSGRFYGLKAKLLGLPRLAYHERNVPYGKIEKDYDFGNSLGLVHKVFAGLDPEFAEILTRFARDGRFDVFPRKGKAGGAFCAHNLLSQPTYVLLNHNGKLKDVLTLAHEMGHAVNNELMRGQHALYFGTSTATAEVASTFMEDFVLKEILREADPELRLAILMLKLNDDVSSVFRQAACYRFEEELHRSQRVKGYLSAPEIGAIFQKHMRAYMGEAVEQSPGAENWWLYWSHIRRFFYVYSYASGLLISKSLQAAVREKPEFIEDVKEFFAAGVSDSPRGIFRKLGVDIAQASFWDKGLATIEKDLDAAEELAQELGKIKI